MYEQPTAPASIGGVLDDGFKLFRASFSKVVGLTIFAGFIGQLPNFFTTVDANGLPEFGGVYLVALLLAMLFSIIFYGAIVSRIHSVRSGHDLSIGESFSLGFACMVPVFICFVGYFLAVTEPLVDGVLGVFHA